MRNRSHRPMMVVVHDMRLSNLKLDTGSFAMPDAGTQLSASVFYGSSSRHGGLQMEMVR